MICYTPNAEEDVETEDIQRMVMIIVTKTMMMVGRLDTIGLDEK